MFTYLLTVWGLARLMLRERPEQTSVAVLKIRVLISTGSYVRKNVRKQGHVIRSYAINIHKKHEKKKRNNTRKLGFMYVRIMGKEAALVENAAGLYSGMHTNIES